MDARYRNIVKNMEYSPMVGCDTAAGVGKKSKVVSKICRHTLCGCKGGENVPHKTERSELCTLWNVSKGDKGGKGSILCGRLRGKRKYNMMVATTRTGAEGVENKSKNGTKTYRHKLYRCIGGGRTPHKYERVK